MANGKQAPSGSTSVVLSQADAFGFLLLAPESSKDEKEVPILHSSVLPQINTAKRQGRCDHDDLDHDFDFNLNKSAKPSALMGEADNEEIRVSPRFPALHRTN